MYQETSENQELTDIVDVIDVNQEFDTMREDHRAILTTSMLRVVSLLGNAVIPRDLLKFVSKEAIEEGGYYERTDSDVVLKELVSDSSRTEISYRR